MFVAHVVRFAQARGKRFVVIRQLGQHIQRLDVFGIIIQHALSSGDLSDRMQSESADLANAFRDDVGREADDNLGSDARSYASENFSFSGIGRTHPQGLRSSRRRCPSSLRA